MKLGLIQTRGIGDIIIGIPIAKYYINKGYEVFWPVDSEFMPFVQKACPEIKFLPVDSREAERGSLEYFHSTPLRQIIAHGCHEYFCLYSYLSGVDIVNMKLSHSLKFDEYKYAVSNVPFSEKWNLQITRDASAEARLESMLKIKKEFVLVHSVGSNFKLEIQLPADVMEQYQIIHITPVTKNPFDWLGVIEKASMLVMIDSCFSNLVEQLNIGKNRHFFLRSPITATPVFRNAWSFH